MDVVESIGGGFVGGGALVLLLTLVALPPHLPGTLHLQNDVVRLRRDRTARTSSAVGIVFTLVGAGLLAIASRVWLTVGAVGAVIVVEWVALAWSVAAHYRTLVPHFDAFVGRPKTPSGNVVALVGLGTWVLGGSQLPANLDAAEAARRARDRSNFVRALAHPFGYRDSL